LNEGKNCRERSFPFLIQIEERISDLVRILSNTRREAAYLVKACALKLALRDTFKADQL
jgi:hypothetical protein